MLDNMTTSEMTSIPIADYQRLIEIALAADEFLRRETAESLEALKDAVLIRTGLID